MQKIYNINALPTTIRIGMQTENGVESIGFDATEWIALWPDMELSVWVCAPGSEEMYESVSRREGAIIWWDVSGDDTAKYGTGAVTILGTTQDGKRKLSKQAETKIRYSGMQSTGEPPQSQQPWYVSAIDAARRAEEAAERAEAAGGEEGRQGADGFSPIVDLEETENGVTVSVTDAEGTEHAFIRNGKDGEQGPQGEPGPRGEQGPQGDRGKDGTDATVTTDSIKSALGYTPANQEDVNSLSGNNFNQETKNKKLRQMIIWILMNTFAMN